MPPLDVSTERQRPTKFAAGFVAGGCAIANGSATRRTNSGVLMSGRSAGIADTFNMPAASISLGEAVAGVGHGEGTVHLCGDLDPIGFAVVRGRGRRARPGC